MRSHNRTSQGRHRSNSSPDQLGGMYDNAHKRLFFKRNNTCQLSAANAPEVDHKNIPLLTRYISARGRILAQRTNNVSVKMQRRLRVAIKRARILALLPFVAK